jgi:Icc-related predicted phosphoesterase
MAQQHSATQFLLVTHIGPSDLGTTDVHPNPARPERSRINAGSTAVRSQLLSLAGHTDSTTGTAAERILALVHGHSHQPWGISQLGTRLTVINPGPLRDGRYGELELVRLNGQQQWRMQSIQLSTMD